jgi:hypothetical protein
MRVPAPAAKIIAAFDMVLSGKTRQEKEEVTICDGILP